MDSLIEAVEAIQILDSRGNPTLAVKVRTADGSTGIAGVPSGISTGEFEAIELRDGDHNVYRGKGVLKAVRNVNGTIRQALVGLDSCNQGQIDQVLIEIDGTDNKRNLGTNAILGVSIAVAKAAAASRGQELFTYLGGNDAYLLPVPLINVINGGAHANNSLDIQEFMIVPHGAPAFSEAMRMSSEIFHALGSLLKDDGYHTGVGDEGGYAPQVESTEVAFDFLLRAIERAGYTPGQDVSLGLDIAASELVEESVEDEFKYIFVKSGEAAKSSDELIAMYEEWLDRYPIVCIEDGLSENDWVGWKDMTSRLGGRIELIGDDLFVTNTSRILQGVTIGVGNAVLVKPNQIGTLTETFAAIETAREARFANVISHRSGETCDTVIADLAVAANAGQIKTGSMCRGERVAKYNRLLWIEHLLGERARYKSPF